jgi:hypothetical protein
MAVNVVCSYRIANEFKKSKYFRQSLGVVATIEKNGQRVFNDKDRFSKYYNQSYRTTIYAQGNVGDVRFYVDHMIHDLNFGVYVGESFEEFINSFDYDMVNEKGVDFYLGHLLKQADEAYEEKKKNDELKKIEREQGIPEKIIQNPGNVTYEDVKAYMEKKQAERYKNNMMK